jgi:hypothetical protein
MLPTAIFLIEEVPGEAFIIFFFILVLLSFLGVQGEKLPSPLV